MVDYFLDFYFFAGIREKVPSAAPTVVCCRKLLWALAVYNSFPRVMGTVQWVNRHGNESTSRWKRSRSMGWKDGRKDGWLEPELRIIPLHSLGRGRSVKN